jgi:ATP-dependent Clp protease ATP-binding subunit ClpC
MSRRSLRAYLVRDRGGLLTGCLVERTFSRISIAATGGTEDDVLAELREKAETFEKTNAAALEPYFWTETLHVAKVKVEVRPENTIAKRRVIGKSRIPIELCYAWAALVGSGFRVMLPRFGWWFLLEELEMAADVIRQEMSSALSGETPRSLFEFREAESESVVELSLMARRTRGRRQDHREEFATLRQVAEDWTDLARAGKLGPHYGPVDEALYTSLLALRRKPSILVVGPSGVGKTAWVKELARRTARAGSDGDGPRIWATSAARIMAGQVYLGMWERRCLDIAFELSGEGHWLYVDRLLELVQPRSGASSIAELLLPALQDDEISLIAECTADEHERLQITSSSLLACFRVIRLEPPSNDRIVGLIVEHQERTDAPLRLDPSAVRRLVRHLALFRKHSAFPGKALLFLDYLAKAAAERAEPLAKRSLTARDADQWFSRYSGLSEKLISDDELAPAPALSEILRRGVVGQDAACRVCADVLARFKAGVNDPDKPLASLLFVGPTGVGKTELAKQIARFLFGSADRLVRLDMSEYLLAGGTARILSDDRGASSLVQRVSREPLSVILLDEIEKAHPAVFDLFLGLLGEGRLTTDAGRLVDFRMTLIVMTSNLGTGATRTGFGNVRADPSDTVRAVRSHFRPEFFNRIDSVVPFGELTPEALSRIVELELEKLGEREGLRRKNLRLEVAPEARARLAQLGWHPQYGARPLKRTLEEHVMMPLAVQLSQRPKVQDRRVLVRCNGDAITVEIEA